VAFVIWNVRGKGGAQFLEKARCLPEKNAKILTERNGEKALFFSRSGAEQWWQWWVNVLGRYPSL